MERCALFLLAMVKLKVKRVSRSAAYAATIAHARYCASVASFVDAKNTAILSMPQGLSLLIHNCFFI